MMTLYIHFFSDFFFFLALLCKCVESVIYFPNPKNNRGNKQKNVILPVLWAKKSQAAKKEYLSDVFRF